MPGLTPPACIVQPCLVKAQNCASYPRLYVRCWIVIIGFAFLLLQTTGKPLAFASCPYTTQFPHPGWAEQQPADWWQALGTAVRAAVAESGVPSSSIAAICLDTTNCTVVALDEGEEQQHLPLVAMQTGVLTIEPGMSHPAVDVINLMSLTVTWHSLSNKELLGLSRCTRLAPCH